MALPFLRNNNEVNSHRLVTTYYHNKGDIYYQQLDITSGVSVVPTDGHNTQLSSSSAAAATAASLSTDTVIKGGKTEVHSIEDAMKQIQTSGLSKKQMMEAEIVHDILRRRLSRLRQSKKRHFTTL